MQCAAAEVFGLVLRGGHCPALAAVALRATCRCLARTSVDRLCEATSGFPEYARIFSVPLPEDEALAQGLQARLPLGGAASPTINLQTLLWIVSVWRTLVGGAAGACDRARGVANRGM